MELRERKFLNNTKPKFDDGWSSGWLSTPPAIWNTNFQSSIGGYQTTPPAQGISPVGIAQPSLSDLNQKANAANILPASTAQRRIKEAGKGSAYGQGLMNAIPATITAVGDVIGSHQYNKSKEELLLEGGESDSNVGGIGYTSYTGPNWSEEMKEVGRTNTANTLKSAGSGAAAGAAIGSIIPGLGTIAGGIIGGAAGLIGGLFGGASRKRKALEALKQALIRATALNNMNRSDALTTSMRQANAREIGNPYTQYGYADGLTPNAMVSNGETIINPDGSTYRVGSGKDNKDTVPVHLSDGQGVITNKYGLSDMALINPMLALNLQTRLKQQGKLNGYKNGKLPGFEDGEPGYNNAIMGGLGALASVGQYLQALNQNIRVPSTYVANPYETYALNDMAGIRINTQPIVNRLYDSYRQANWGVDRSAGLSGGQRNRVKSANLLTTQKSINEGLIGSQHQNNQYRSAVDSAMINAGQATRQARMADTQYKEEMTARAHAARQQGMQMGIYNLLSQLLQFYANDFKRRQFNDTMNLYRQQQLLDKERFDADIAAKNMTTVPSNVADYYNRMMKAWNYSHGYFG